MQTLVDFEGDDFQLFDEITRRRLAVVKRDDYMEYSQSEECLTQRYRDQMFLDYFFDKYLTQTQFHTEVDDDYIFIRSSEQEACTQRLEECVDIQEKRLAARVQQVDTK